MPGIYTPDATDVTRPADNDDASIAAGEMRAIKIRMGTLNTAEALAAAAAAEAAALDAAAAATAAAAAAAMLGANTLIQYCGLAVGTANALVISPAITVLSYVEGQEFTFIAASTNTAINPTIQVSLLTPLTTDIPIGGIVAGSTYKCLVKSGLASAVVHDITNVVISVIPVPFFVRQFFPTF